MKEKSDEILDCLKKNLEPFDINSDFSLKPGIYAIGFVGEEFPLNSAQNYIKRNNIIYIGKAESNQKARDLKTHFESGKSGSSTLRRSFGAILYMELELIPIPRSCKENGARRFTNYKFTSKGEGKLTEWMKANLSLSYYEWNDTISDLRKMETKIIKSLSPILNLQNNSGNEWKVEIKNLRKDCKNFAEKNKNLCK